MAPYQAFLLGIEAMRREVEDPDPAGKVKPEAAQAKIGCLPAAGHRSSPVSANLQQNMDQIVEGAVS